MTITEKPRVAPLISRRIKELNLTQREIAKLCNWRPNVISMIKQGQMRVPLDKIGLLALALSINPAKLFWLCLKEYAPDTLFMIESITGIVVFPHELRVLAAYRRLAGGKNLAKEVVISDGEKSIRVPVESEG